MFLGMLICDYYEESAAYVVGDIVLKFVVIAIGGPIFGWFMARIAIFCLSRIFNDATVGQLLNYKFYLNGS
jgi:hypothetical protein